MKEIMVETFECPEVSTEHPEVTAEAMMLIERLGLKGQEKLNTKTDAGDEVRCPYRVMTREEMFVYGVLCPRKTDENEYGEEPIPLRVLQVLAHAHSLQYFEGFQIWHRESSTVQDPVLVGTWRGRRNGRGWDETETYILARWGEVLEAFGDLKKKAVTLHRQARLQKLAEIQNEVEAAIRSTKSAETFASTSLPWFNAS